MFLHIFSIYFINQFQIMYQLLFSFRLTPSDILVISLNVVKSRSLLRKIILLQHNKVYSRYKNFICCYMKQVTTQNNMRNTHILTNTTSCVSNARSNRKKIFFQIISTSFIFAMLVFFRTWQFLDA